MKREVFASEGVCEEYFKYVFVYVLSLVGSLEDTFIIYPNASNSPLSHLLETHTISTLRGRNKEIKLCCLGLCLIFCQVQFVLACSQIQLTWAQDACSV